MEILAAFLAILSAIIPPLVAHFVRTNAQAREEDDALTLHSISELHIGTDSVRKSPPV